jgi:tetratricopeptide (TPR) repeat protein
MARARSKRHRATATIALSALLYLVFSSCAGAADSPALTLLRDIQRIHASGGRMAPEQVLPLLELGRIYSGGQCEYAIEMLDLALAVSRRNEGLFNPAQIEIFEPLMNCYVHLDLPTEMQRAQHHLVRIDEQRYGPQDVRLLSTLDEGARRYEQVGLYLSARSFHRRALEIARRALGDRDLSLVRPLRGMARAFRLEYVYGLALPDVNAPLSETYGLRSLATFDERVGIRLDGLGRRSLEQAVVILRDHPEADIDIDERFGTLLDLGDWYQITGNRREALRIYRELWNQGQSELLSEAQPLFVRRESSVALRRPPVDADARKKYVIDFAYTVTRDGRATDISIVESNAPTGFATRAMRDLKHTRFRPRFVDGEPVDTTGMHQRQSYYDR